MSFPHLDPVDTGDHFSKLADCKGEEEGDGETEDVEHGETQKGRFCSHYLECFTFHSTFVSISRFMENGNRLTSPVKL